MTDIPLTLTETQTRAVKRGSRRISLTMEQARAIRSAELPTGRPRALGPCKYCGREMGARERREHQPRCPKR